MFSFSFLFLSNEWIRLLCFFCLLIVQRLIGWFVDTWRGFGIPFLFLVT